MAKCALLSSSSEEEALAKEDPKVKATEDPKVTAPEDLEVTAPEDLKATVPEDLEAATEEPKATPAESSRRRPTRDVEVQTVESRLEGPPRQAAAEPAETWSVVTEPPQPTPVAQQVEVSEEDGSEGEEMRVLKRLRRSVRETVEGMHLHIAKQVREASVKAMPRRKPVASKAMPKGKKRGSVDSDPGPSDKKPEKPKKIEEPKTVKDTRVPAEPSEPPRGRVELVPRTQRKYRCPPPPKAPEKPPTPPPVPPPVPKTGWMKGLPYPPPVPK